MSVDLTGQLLGGKYRLVRVLGQGGMGTVWRAEHVELGSAVALKLMAPALAGDEPARTRFRREARAAAKLRHRHVVVVHDFGEHAGTPYLVMELLVGETLQQQLDRSGRLAPARVGELVQQAAAALGAAHAQGIVHRDIKPSNLFVCDSEPEPCLKVLDFGIARAALDDEGRGVTCSGVIIGSPAFMSPEQASGDPVGHTGDLWSLAAVAYRALTGVEPFGGRTVTETLARIRAGRFTSPSKLVGELPRALDAFFTRAFALEARERFATAEQFGRAFAAAIQGAEQEVVDIARDHTTRILPVGRTRTRRLAVLLAAVIVVVGASVWLSRRESGSPAARAAAEQPSAPPAPALTPARNAPLPAPDPAPSEHTARAAPEQAVPRPKPVRAQRPPAKSKLTAPVALDTPVKSSATTDPLFGLPVKKPLGAAAAFDAGARGRP